MKANFTRGGKSVEGGDTGASGASPMREMRPLDPRHREELVRNIGLEAAPPPPMFDTGLGQSFFLMRTKLAVSVWDMARLVDSEPTVIANLEAGALDALPAWSELTRIVETYGALTGTDAAPLLARLIKGYASTGPAVSQPITAHLPPARAPEAPPARSQETVDEIVPYDEAMRTKARAQPAAGAGTRIDRSQPVEDIEADEEAEPEQPPSRRRGSTPAWLAILVLSLVVAAILAARMQPSILYAAASPWPQVIRQPLVSGIDWLVLAIAPRRDGLVWIDAGNPAWRKTDKLPEAKP